MTDSEKPPNYKSSLCEHFKRGLCRQGARCTYAHGGGELRRPAKKPCDWFMSKGGCRKGDSCPFSHDPADHPPPGQTPNARPGKECKFFLESKCFKGDKCDFLHISPEDSSSSTSETGPQSFMKVDAIDLEEIASQELFATSSRVGGFSVSPEFDFEVSEKQMRFIDWDALASLQDGDALDDNYDEEHVKVMFDASEEYRTTRRLQDTLRWLSQAPVPEAGVTVIVISRDLLRTILKYSLYKKDPDWKIVAVKKDRFVFLEEKYDSKDKMDYHGWYCSEKLRERVTWLEGQEVDGFGSYYQVDCKSLTEESFQLWVVGVSNGFDDAGAEKVPCVVKNMAWTRGKELTLLKAEVLFFEAVCMGASQLLMTYRENGKILGSWEQKQPYELLASFEERGSRMGKASTFLRKFLRWIIQHLEGGSTSGDDAAYVFESSQTKGARRITVQKHLAAWAEEILRPIRSLEQYCWTVEPTPLGDDGSEDVAFTTVEKKKHTKASSSTDGAKPKGAAVVLPDDPEESTSKKGDAKGKPASDLKTRSKAEIPKIKATIISVHEDSGSVRIRLSSGEFRQVDILSFQEAWVMLPRYNDEVEYVECKSRRINPKLSKVSGRMSLEEMADFLEKLEERGHTAMLDVVTYNMLYVDHVLQYLEYSSRWGSASLESLMRLARSLSGPAQASSSCSEAQVLSKIFESRYWMQTLPRAVDEGRVNKETVSQVTQFLQDIVVGALPRQVYHSRRLLESCVRFRMKDASQSPAVIQELLAVVVALSSCFAVDAGHTKFVPWKQLPLVPKILSEDLTDVKDLPKVKSEYESFEDYMDTFFRLLRADCFGPLQDGVKSFVQDTLDPRDLRVYHVNIAGIHSLRNSKSFAVAVECQNYHRTGRVRFGPRSLMQSNLVCLSIGATPFSDVLWARVVDRPEKNKSLNNDKLEVIIEFLEELNSKKPFELLLALLTPEGPMLLADNPVFYLSFGPVLRRLKAMTERSLPFDSLLLARKEDAKRAHKELPWTDDCMSSLEDTITTRKRVFDPAQDQALRTMLSSTISTIQGPPGTGKSFIAVEATRHILNNQHVRRHQCRASSSLTIGELLLRETGDYYTDSEYSCSPPSSDVDIGDDRMRVLLLAEKNHALDESLRDVMKANPFARVVRIGGRCEEPKLEKKTLMYLARLRKKSPHIGARLHETITARNGLVQKLSEDLWELLPGMSPASLLRSHASKEQLQSLMRGCKNTKRSHLLAHRRMQHALDCGDWVCQEDLQDCCSLWQPTPEAAPSANSSKRNSSTPDEEESDGEAGIEIKERKALIEATGAKTPLLTMDSSKTKVPILGPLSGDVDGSASYLSDQTDLWALSNKDRSRLLGLFLRRVLREQREDTFVDETLQQIEQLTEEIAALERAHKVQILREADVVACTISGASIQCELLADIDFSVVIVEEAAEILEPQLVAALPPSCQQLMMIGDPYQLRPKIQTYRLARDLNFDQSLMERLLNSEHGYPKVMLRTQNRMRDEFLCMLRPHYPELVTNFERVAKNKPLDFVRKTMYFVNSPKNYESASEVGRSVINKGEAKVIVEFVEHIVREGTPKTDISVLAMYDGQVAHLRRLLRDIDYEEVVVSTVDRYQGDENKIVLVSLVRSNNEGKIGFVYERNRLIVAASRARSGVYFFGNGDLLEAKSKDWKALIQSLKEQGCYGSKLPVCCPRHPDLDLEIGKRCHHICNALLECEHYCQEPCHPAGKHPKCLQECVVPLACGHDKACKCHEAQNPDLLVCNEKIDFHHAVCGHADRRKCSSKEKPCKEKVMMQCLDCQEWGETDCNTKHFEKDKFRCQKPCKRLMSCSHPCTRLCHQDCDASMDDCELCEKARELAREEKLQEVKQMLESMGKDDYFHLGELRRDGVEWRFRELENQVKSFFVGKQLEATVLSIEEVTNNKLKRRYLQQQDSVVGASSESETTRILEMSTKEQAMKAAKQGLAEALPGRPTEKRGKKQKGQFMQASFVDFFDQTALERADVRQRVPRHLLVCKVQQGRVYQTGQHGHRKSLDEKVPKDFDSMYCPETRKLRLDRLSLALPTLLISVEVKRSEEPLGGLPSYWTSSSGTGSWSVVALPPTSTEATALAEAILPRGALGGRDLHARVDFSSFRMAQAWRLENPGLWATYQTRKKFIKDMLAKLEEEHGFKPRKVEVDRQYQALGERMPGALDSEINEVLLSHGTKPETLMPILGQGVNERYSKGLFGQGTYFAEDVGKNNHYVSEDSSFNSTQELHRLLFTDNHVAHPGKIYYVFFCRVILGAPVRTQDGRTNMDNPGSSVWSSEQRELACIKLPSASASTPVYHSLLAELGGCIHQYREFMVYNSSQVYPEYLVAFHRT